MGSRLGLLFIRFIFALLSGISNAFGQRKGRGQDR